MIVFLAILPLLLINDKLLQFLGATIVLIVGLYFNSKYLDKIKFSEYGLLFKKETLNFFLAGIFIGIIAVITILLIGKSVGVLSVSEFRFGNKPLQIVIFSFKMLLISILEETFFRGYLYTNLYNGFTSEKISKKQSILIALFLSSILFGLAHTGNNNASLFSILALTFNGIIWCIPFIITKNLGLSIGMHLAWNFTQTQLGFTMSGNSANNSFFEIQNIGSDYLTGGVYGPEAGVLGIVGFVIMLILSLTYLRFIDKNRLLT